ncbi:MAG TPA: hypothetical protein VIU12_20495 [Chryseolinea sp.]
MGLDFNSIKLLIWSTTAGIEISKCAMLGRLSFMGVTDADVAGLLAKAGYTTLREPDITPTGYVEPLLRHLGAQLVESFDASSYENATHLWDMNTPVSSEFHDRYSLVLDGGTLEHVFNFPNAISSAMRMVRKDGHLIVCVPADGMFGHGFYQFSAELLYSLFSPSNGYNVAKMFIFQDYARAPIYEVISPAALQQRNKLCSNMPALLYAICKRIGDVPDKLEVMQSDYVNAWKADGTNKGQSLRIPFNTVYKRRYIKSLATAILNFPFWAKRSFVRWNP